MGRSTSLLLKRSRAREGWTVVTIFTDGSKGANIVRFISDTNSRNFECVVNFPLEKSLIQKMWVDFSLFVAFGRKIDSTLGIFRTSDFALSKISLVILGQ